MITMIKVARYHLTQPALVVVLPWASLAGVFAANVARGGDRFRDGLATIFLMFFLVGVQRIGRWLPFGLALGMTRRSFYAGTALLGVSMSLVSGLVIAGLQAIERATDGWGLSVLFVYGMWYGIVNRR
jgi:hypothetical protein